MDDSGDPGFKFERGSSELFVIACVIFDSPYEAEFASAGIRLLKDKMGWRQHREFKFNKTNDEQRKAFLLEMKRYDFRIRAVVVDKERITKPKLRGSENFYNLVVSDVLERFDNMKEAMVKLDGSGDRGFKRKMTSNVRKKLNRNGKRKIADFALEDSQDNVLIQLADMVAGAIRLRYNRNKTLNTNYLRPLLGKIEDIWLYDISD